MDSELEEESRSMDNYNSLQEEKVPDELLRENIIRRNKKKIAQGSELTGKSMLKKSDLSLVFIGAGIITLIIFFVFLRPSGDQDNSIVNGDISEQAKPSIEESVKTLEQKLTTLEEMLQAINASQASAEGQPKVEMPDIKPYVARIERVETALSVKFDVLTARVDKLDDKLSDIIRDVEKNSKLVNNLKNSAATPTPKKEEVAAVQPSVPVEATNNKTKPNTNNSEVKPKEVKPKENVIIKSSAKISTKTADEPKKAGTTVNKTASTTKTNTKPEIAATPQKQQKSNNKGGLVYHTVAKGDTLYNISKRYDTTVEQLRAMNKMTIQDAIVIGQKLVVKK